MAMNKTEKAEMESLRQKVLELSTRVVISGKIDTDIPAPCWGDGITNGWSYNPYTHRVEKSCSTSNGHNKGHWDKTTSQRAISQYSTELLATKALRWEVEQDLYKQLTEIDKRIAMLEVE